MHRINSFEELERIKLELKKLQENPPNFKITEKEKETNKSAHEIYNRVLAQVLDENGWNKI